MGSFFAEIVAELLEWYLDIKFWFKKRKRRKFEKENNLPKRLMIYPSDKIYLALLVLGLISITLFMFFVYPDIKENKTEEKLNEIVEILNQEKKILGTYPQSLKMIIRNNPLRQNITKDAWGNDFEYQLSEDGKSYVLSSLGKDAKPKTDDDIMLNNKKHF